MGSTLLPLLSKLLKLNSLALFLMGARFFLDVEYFHGIVNVLTDQHFFMHLNIRQSLSAVCFRKQFRLGIVQTILLSSVDFLRISPSASKSWRSVELGASKTDALRLGHEEYLSCSNLCLSSSSKYLEMMMDFFR
ncbi:hypothetical protein BpHYR1_048912 [Brachionus plicatilis]|uniref:Uncharacterized protein n=1 Tax=Brachionus plicatilis TaxID=10195 RepID=A0A3M7S107_BRAPC|nr:hypothetical protein BpHYR1_048912 [Brachionus plicatilis]